MCCKEEIRLKLLTLHYGKLIMTNKIVVLNKKEVSSVSAGKITLRYIRGFYACLFSGEPSVCKKYSEMR